MEKAEFPLFSTKVKGVNQKFNLIDAGERKRYFEAKASNEIKKLKGFFKNNTFIVYLLGKKNSGKGTYAKMMQDIFGDSIVHVSIGDLVRKVHKEVLENEKEKEELFQYLKKNYRGYMSVDDAFQALLSRDTKTLLPDEFILSLVKREIGKLGRKTLFIDGFPRNFDQISYSLFFRDLINYREDPDIFVMIDLPKTVIDERIKHRLVCPACNTSRNLKLLSTKKMGFDKEKKEFYLICDNENCKGKRMEKKEGDELGIEPIKQRLETDEKLITEAFNLYGIPKILLRNTIPTSKAETLVDDYEITPEYVYSLNEKNEVEVKEKPWIVKDDEGTDSYSLLAPPIIIVLIKKLVEVLGL